MIFAWLFLSNHCAISAIEGGSLMAKCAQCEGVPSQANQSQTNQSHDDHHGSNSDEMVCCQMSKPVLSAQQNAPVYDASAFAFVPFAVSDFLFPVSQGSSLANFDFDTGPPAALSFTEIVLQRSLLAHAPPFFV